jgi:hypothetical protein
MRRRTLQHQPWLRRRGDIRLREPGRIATPALLGRCGAGFPRRDAQCSGEHPEIAQEIARIGRIDRDLGGTRQVRCVHQPFRARCGAISDRDRFPTAPRREPSCPAPARRSGPAAWLREHPAEVVIIPPQWRARDIVAEMAKAAITFERALIEHEGALIEFFRDPHPYLDYNPRPRNRSRITARATSVRALLSSHRASI